jgi:hypothetical protein
MRMLQRTVIFASSMRAAKIISILPIGSYSLNYLAPLKDLYCGPRKINRADRLGEPLKRDVRLLSHRHDALQVHSAGTD